MTSAGRGSNSKINLLKIPDFQILLSARSMMYMALQIQAVIVGWHIYAIKKDPMLLGMIGLAEAIPAILGAFIAGHVVDTSRPAKVFTMSILAVFINCLLLFIAVNPTTQSLLSLREATIVNILFIGVFISGAARSFTSPSVYSMIPKIVPRSLMSSAAAFNSSTYQIAAITGPAVGGLIYGFFGDVIAFVFPCLLSAKALVASLLFSNPVRRHQNHLHSDHF